MHASILIAAGVKLGLLSIAIFAAFLSNECHAEPVITTNLNVVFVFFRVNQYGIDDRFDQDIRGVACEAKVAADLQISVQGFSDPQGTLNDNQKLSEARAIAVASQLSRYGLSCDRLLQIKGFSENKAHGAQQQPFLRRVDILRHGTIIKDGGYSQCLIELTAAPVIDHCQLKP